MHKFDSSVQSLLAFIKFQCDSTSAQMLCAIFPSTISVWCMRVDDSVRVSTFQFDYFFSGNVDRSHTHAHTQIGSIHP